MKIDYILNIEIKKFNYKLDRNQHHQLVFLKKSL